MKWRHEVACCFCQKKKRRVFFIFFISKCKLWAMKAYISLWVFLSYSCIYILEWFLKGWCGWDWFHRWYMSWYLMWLIIMLFLSESQQIRSWFADLDCFIYFTQFPCGTCGSMSIGKILWFKWSLATSNESIGHYYTFWTCLYQLCVV